MKDPNLSINEKKVLINLHKSNQDILNSLANNTKLKIESVMQASFLLEKKGFVEINENVIKTYCITNEAIFYVENGLPERQVINFIKTKNLESIENIRKKYSPKIANIAINWLLKKKWATIEDGFLIPTKTHSLELDEDEILLKNLDKTGKTIEELNANIDTIQTLIKRKLIETKETKIITISITDDGKNFANKGIIIEEEILQLTTDILKSKSWINKKFKPYDINLAPKQIYGAKMHPYQRLIDEMRKIFFEMGFTEIKGDIVQSSFWNFDALFQPQDHPAREMQDTFYLDSESDIPENYVKKVSEMHINGGNTNSTGWGGNWSESIAKKNVLRTHTTAVTIKYLADNPDKPTKAFCIDRAYRRETIDPTHTPEFEQLEGVVMDKNMSFSNLLGFLTEFYHRLGFTKVRFRPGYFPYTEPSVEPEVYIEGMGWVELGGAGIFRKEVTNPLEIKYPVLAWGLGVSRLAMLKLGLKDLRELYQSDIDWLRKSKMNAI